MKRAIVLIACLALPQLCLADKDRIYRWTDSKGVVHYSQIEPKGKAETRDIVRKEAVNKPIIAKTKSADEVSCEKARLNADLLAGSGPLQTDKDGDGKAETLSPEERAEAKALSDRQVKFYCKGN